MNKNDFTVIGLCTNPQVVCLSVKTKNKTQIIWSHAFGFYFKISAAGGKPPGKANAKKKAASRKSMSAVETKKPSTPKQGNTRKSVGSALEVKETDWLNCSTPQSPIVSKGNKSASMSKKSNSSLSDLEPMASPPWLLAAEKRLQQESSKNLHKSSTERDDEGHSFILGSQTSKVMRENIACQSTLDTFSDGESLIKSQESLLWNCQLPACDRTSFSSCNTTACLEKSDINGFVRSPSESLVNRSTCYKDQDSAPFESECQISSTKSFSQSHSQMQGLQQFYRNLTLTNIPSNIAHRSHTPADQFSLSDSSAPTTSPSNTMPSSYASFERDQDTEDVQCPLCGDSYPACLIEMHAAACGL